MDPQGYSVVYRVNAKLVQCRTQLGCVWDYNIIDGDSAGNCILNVEQTLFSKGID